MVKTLNKGKCMEGGRECKSGGVLSSPAVGDYLDSLFPAGATHLTPKELAGISGYTSSHILASIDEGRLGAFLLPGRGGSRLHARIPVALARGFLLANSTALEDALVLDQFARAAAALPHPLKRAVCAELQRQLSAGG